MKRRDFFKTVTGFVAGIVAAFVPKAKGLTLEKLRQCRDELERAEKFNTEDFDGWNPKDGWEGIEEVFLADSRQQHRIGTYLIASNGLRFRYVRKPIGVEVLGHKTTRPFWCWIPENEFIENPPQEYLDNMIYLRIE